MLVWVIWFGAVIFVHGQNVPRPHTSLQATPVLFNFHVGQIIVVDLGIMMLLSNLHEGKDQPL